MILIAIEDMMENAKKIFLATVFIAIAVVVCVGMAHAQGSRKDDIVFNAQGRPMAGATVRICTSTSTGQPCSPLASIYSDPALTQALANPLSADGLGNYTFYATPGRYEIEISGPGITTKQLPNVILPSDPSTPTFTTVTTISGISAFSLSLTGNLTVTGSTAVAGSLTVGGAPVPSTNADNQWTANQRFGGPIPWRDFTKYMPAGGCTSLSAADPPATGTISSGSPNLAVSNAADFKNGCGIAVIGAGPTATLTMAGTASGSVQICSDFPGCTNHTGTQIMFTVGSGSLPLVPAFGNGSNAAGFLVISGCSNSTFNTTGTGWTLDNGTAPVTQITYQNGSVSGGTSTTGCTATFYGGWPHGVTGSTTYNYKVAPIDANGGVGPAVGPITITNGNAALTPSNYNVIVFQGAPQTRMYAIYSDKGLGGALTCINVAYTMGYVDWGITDSQLATPCPPYVPTTPPSSATAETLNTTITSGAGTTSLVLAANASNNATTQNVYDDVSGFLNSCINDVIADQFVTPGRPSGSYGCYIPYGRWPFNADMPTDTISGLSVFNAGGVNLWFAGTPYFQTWPWMIGQNYYIHGIGTSSAASGLNGISFPAVLVDHGLHMPTGAVIRGAGVTLEGFNFSNMQGHGLMITNDSAMLGNGSAIHLRNLALNVQNAYGTGVPLLIDGNTLYVSAENLNLTPRSNGFPASILFTTTSYNQNGQCCVFIRNLFTE